MSWGIVGNIVKTNLDNDADDPSLARADLEAALTELENVINGRNTANGVAGLDASQKIPAALLPNTIASDISQNLILAADTGRTAIQDIINLNPKTVSELGAVSSVTGDVAYCSNGDAGSPCIAVYNGTNWLRIALGTAISAT